MSEALLPDPISVTVRAPAKINVYLGVGKARPDGFHPLETVYQAVSLYDDVTVTDAEEWSVSTITDGAHVDAARCRTTTPTSRSAPAGLAAHHQLERAARIEVRKSIPVAGGMAGGSADAAATLVALDRLWNLNTSDDELLALAAELGSDVPFALIGGTATGTGRGEVVTPVEDNGTWWWVVVFDDEGLSTPSVYGAYDLLEGGDHDYRVRPALLETLRDPAGNPDGIGMFVYNDLEDAAFYLRPDLQSTAEAALECGAMTTLLSGSGPTMLAIAADADDARSIAGQLAERGYDRTAGRPRPGGRRARGGLRMSNLLNLERVSKSYGVRPLLTDVSLGVAAGERIGIVGRNGDGKTTLLRVMTGEEGPDRGRVSRQRGLLVGYLSQSDDFSDTHTVRDVVLGGRSDHEWAADAALREIVTVLLAGVELDRAVSGLSGGERRRCALAGLLIGEHDLIVLDEPTNHLDVEAIAWLAAHLRGADVGARRGHPRPVVPRRGLPADVGGPRRGRRRVRGRLRRVRAREGRAAATGRRLRGTSGRTSSARSSPGCAGVRPPARPSRSSASTPPTRSSRTCRRRATGSSCQRFATQRLGKDVIDVEDVDLSARRSGAARARDLAARARRPGRPRRRQRRRQDVGAVADLRRRWRRSTGG